MSDERYYYYHAGAVEGTRCLWSTHTRRTREAAEAEAKRLARGTGLRPVVEYWSREHGLRPGDQELVLGADFVD